VAALQHLPPRQRAALVLRDALGFSSAEVAGMLEASEASVNSALQRARGTMATRLPGADRDRAPLPRSSHERDLAARFASAYAADDVDAIVALLTDDAWYTMPPATLEYQGPAAIAGFLTLSARYRGVPVRLIPTRANGQPAFGCYVADEHAGIYHAHGIMVLTLAADRISAITRFIDSGIIPRFGLPRTLPG
jgi:RNA polymerase sigma-70 factor (ECF subfamily)